MSFYRYQTQRGAMLGGDLVERVAAAPGRYLPFLEHVERRNGRRRSKIRIRVRRQMVPVLLPAQMTALREAEARWDGRLGGWVGELRYRLLWTLLEETGIRLGEALGLQHRDWKTSTGDTALVEVVERDDHPHGQRAKSGSRRIHVGAGLDRLYGDWVWALCEAGADVELEDWDRAYIFCNLHRGRRFAPLRPESIYKHLTSMKRRVPGLPAAMTPHWFRHSHATALLLAGVPEHVVSRRLGHADIQTTLNLYGHVTEDAELRTCADWQAVIDVWRDYLAKGVSFTAVAREAGVSTDFLYRHQRLRSRIERHRAKSGLGRNQRQPGEELSGSSSSAVRALARRLEDERREHRIHTAELRRALEAAHGENLELRRRLARYEPG